MSDDRLEMNQTAGFPMFFIGFHTFVEFRNVPFIPMPVFESDWDRYDWCAGYGAAVRRITLPKGWLV